LASSSEQEIARLKISNLTGLEDLSGLTPNFTTNAIKLSLESKSSDLARSPGPNLKIWTPAGCEDLDSSRVCLDDLPGLIPDLTITL